MNESKDGPSQKKQFQDVVGYYNRFDVFQLKVNRRAHSPVHFHEEGEDDAAGATQRPALPEFPVSLETSLLS